MDIIGLSGFNTIITSNTKLISCGFANLSKSSSINIGSNWNFMIVPCGLMNGYYFPLTVCVPNQNNVDQVMMESTGWGSYTIFRVTSNTITGNPSANIYSASFSYFLYIIEWYKSPESFNCFQEIFIYLMEMVSEPTWSLISCAISSLLYSCPSTCLI